MSAKASQSNSNADQRPDVDVKSSSGTDPRQNRMMAHLLDALEQGQDIGHYGRLVFTMVARHFMDEEQLVSTLANDRDFSKDDARSLYLQVQARDYNPPKREKIMAWQAQQDFQIIPDADDPDEGNVYKDLRFPDGVYDNIQEYYEDKVEAQESERAA